jgi:hypothetical protein
MSNGSVMARAQQLRKIANEQLAKAEQASELLTRRMCAATAKAYSQWALEVEQIARTIERIERSAEEAPRRTKTQDSLPDEEAHSRSSE